MSANLPAPRSGWIPEWVADLKHIPGAAAAIARVVGGAGKAGTAWLDVVTAKAEQRSQAIRDQTGAHTALTKEAVKVAAAQMKKDPELAERAVDHVMAGMIQKQENREAIAMKAIEHLREEPPEHPTSEPPSEDWMNVFEAHAEKASSDRLQEHWAQILAGEIRKPGSFSLLTLQFMSVLDPKLAATVERAAPQVADGKVIFTTADNDEGEALLDLVTLDSVGFLRRNLSKFMTLSESGKAHIQFGDFGIEIGGTPSQRVNMNCCVLTQLGEEVLQIVKPKPDLDTIRAVAKRAYVPHVESVKLFAVTSRQANRFSYTTLEDVPKPNDNAS
jgi:hypothetical protein